MNKHLKLFANHTAYEAVKNNIDKPNVVMCQSESELHYNAKKKYTPTPGLSNEEDIVELANLYIEEYNIENGTNLQLRYSMGITGDVPQWYDDCNNKYSECYLGILDSNTFTSNMLRKPSIREAGYYCYYFPESGCCKIEYYSSHS